MTLILALKCSEGLVIASDSAAHGQTTCGQLVKQNVDKLFPLGSSIVWGVAGDEGLQQKIETALEKINSLDRPIKDLRPDLHSAINDVQKKAREDFIKSPRCEMGFSETSNPATADVLLVGYTNRKAWILEIDRYGKDTQHEDKEFCAVGLGDSCAYAIRNSILHLDVSKGKLYHCQMGAYRIVDSVIETLSELGGPIQMWIVKEGEKARQLTQAEVDALRDTVNRWKHAESTSFSSFSEPRQNPS